MVLARRCAAGVPTAFSFEPYPNSRFPKTNEAITLPLFFG